MRRRKGRTAALENIPGVKELLKNVVKGLEIEQARGVLFYNDITNKQLIIQSPPLIGRIFYVPHEKIKEIK